MVDSLSSAADVLSKTELVSKMAQKQKAASEMEQRQAISTVKRKNTSESERTKEAIESDQVIINRENPKQNGGKKEKREKLNDEAEDGSDASEAEGGHLDMKA